MPGKITRDAARNGVAGDTRLLTKCRYPDTTSNTACKVGTHNASTDKGGTYSHAAVCNALAGDTLDGSEGLPLIALAGRLATRAKALGGSVEGLPQ